MISESIMKFTDARTTTGESNVYFNSSADICTLQVTGTDYSIKLQGRTDAENGGWVDLKAINLKTFGVTVDIAADGLYQYSINGLTQIRVYVSSVTGSVTSFARMTL